MSSFTPIVLQFGGSVDGTGVDVGVVFLVVGVVFVVVVIVGSACFGLISQWSSSIKDTSSIAM